MSRPINVDRQHLVDLRESNPELWTWQKLAEYFGSSPSYVCTLYGKITGKAVKRRPRAGGKVFSKAIYTEAKKTPIKLRPVQSADLGLQEESVIRPDVQRKLMTRGK